MPLTFRRGAAAQEEDSIHGSDQPVEDKKKTKSRRPPNTAFRQQRLKAWQPILTPKTVIPLYFAIGIVLAPIGGLLLWADSKVQELSIDYSNCPREAPTDYAQISPDRVSSSFKSTSSSLAPQPVQWKVQGNQTVTYDHGVSVPDTWICYLKFTIPNPIKPPVLFYYRLTRFYQNHRLYVKSFDASQLAGQARSSDAIKSSNCDPLRNDPSGKPYYPCGLIANSLFNDTFSNLTLLNSQDGGNGTTSYNMTKQGIAWSSDGKLYKKTAYNGSEIVPPPNWIRRFPNGYTDFIPDISQDQSLWVWMRTAGLPTLSKLAMRNDTAPLPQGQYELAIWDEWNTTLWSGSKSVLITNVTVMGGKNPFLGIAYIVVGGICILLGLIFTVMYMIKPRKLGDHTYLSWNKEPPAKARTTGRAPRAGESN